MADLKLLLSLMFGVSCLRHGFGQTVVPSPIARVLYGDTLELTCSLDPQWESMVWDRKDFGWALTAFRTSCGLNKTRIGYYITCQDDAVTLHQTHPTTGHSYTCQQNVGDVTTSSVSTTVDVYIAGPYLETNQMMLSVRETEKAELICKAKGGPSITVSWTRENSSESLPAITTPQGTILTMYNLSRDQTGTYICHGSFIYQGNNYQNQTSMELNVLYAPSVVVQGGGTVRDGTTPTLSCVTDGNPPTNFVVWKHFIGSVLVRHLNGSNGPGSTGLDSTGPVLNGLVIPEVRYQDSGTYVCTVSNGVTGNNGQTEQTNSTYVNVQHSPIWLDNNVPTEHFKEKNTVVEFTFRYLSNPITSLPVVMEANTNKTLTNSTRVSILSQEFDDMLYIYGKQIQKKTFSVDVKFSPIQKEDSGEYVIRIQNAVSSQERSFTVNVLDKPTLPSEVRYEVVSYTNITLHWGYKYEVNEFLSFLVKCQTESHTCGEERLFYNDTQTEYTYRVTKLRPDTKHFFSICAENPLGKRCTTTISVKTKEIIPSGTVPAVVPVPGAAPQLSMTEQNSDKSTVTVVAIAVSVGVALLICLVVVVKLSRDRRRKRAIPKVRASGMYEDDVLNSSERRAVANNYLTKPALPARGDMSMVGKTDYDVIGTGCALRETNEYEQIPADMSVLMTEIPDSKGKKKPVKYTKSGESMNGKKKAKNTFSNLHNEYSSLILTPRKLPTPGNGPVQTVSNFAPPTQPLGGSDGEQMGYLTPGELPQRTTQQETNPLEKNPYLDMAESKQSTTSSQPERKSMMDHERSDILEKCGYIAMNKVAEGQNQESMAATEKEELRFDAYHY